MTQRYFPWISSTFGLGYYGSCALFALSHHYVVWLAAKLSAYPGKFSDYAVLGDDVVIANPQVAAKYEWLLEQMGVTISKDFSLLF